MALSCFVGEIQRVAHRKSGNFLYPPVFTDGPHSGWFCWISRRCLILIKLEWLSNHVVKTLWWYVKRWVKIQYNTNLSHTKSSNRIGYFTWTGSVIRNSGMNAGKMCLEKSASEAFSAINIMFGSTNGTMLLLEHSLQRLGNTRCRFTRCKTTATSLNTSYDTMINGLAPSYIQELWALGRSGRVKQSATGHSTRLLQLAVVRCSRDHCWQVTKSTKQCSSCSPERQWSSRRQTTTSTTPHGAW